MDTHQLTTASKTNTSRRALHHTVATLAGLVLLGGASIASAGGDIARGKAAAQVCASCHGEGGKSDNPLFPNIAGQYESYLINSLRQYREGANPSRSASKGGIIPKQAFRKNAIMAGQAGQLTDQQIADLAAYFASQSGGLYTPSNWDQD